MATALTLVGLAMGSGAWLVQQRAERRAELRSEVGTAVAQAASLRKRSIPTSPWPTNEAGTLFEQSLEADSAPGRAVVNWLWLALAHQRFGEPDEARRWLGKATAWLDQYRDGMPPRAEAELGLHLHNWLEAHVLRREAEALIRPAVKR